MKLKDFIRKNTSTIGWMIIIPVFTIIVNVLYSQAQNDFGTNVVLVSLVFLTITCIGILFIYYKYILKQLKETIEPAISDNFAVPVDEDFIYSSLLKDTVISDRELSEFETDYQGSEIWVVSNDLATELDGGLYADIVPNNLKRGIVYRMFVAPSSQTNIKIAQLKRMHKDFGDIKYYILDDDFFFLVSNLDFTIYEPYSTFSTGRKGYIGFDLPGTDEIYAARVTDALVGAVSSRLNAEYIEKNRNV